MVACECIATSELTKLLLPVRAVSPLFVNTVCSILQRLQCRTLMPRRGNAKRDINQRHARLEFFRTEPENVSARR